MATVEANHSPHLLDLKLKLKCFRNMAISVCSEVLGLDTIETW